jgi:hypothetical protein
MKFITFSSISRKIIRGKSLKKTEMEEFSDVSFYFKTGLLKKIQRKVFLGTY